MKAKCDPDVGFGSKEFLNMSFPEGFVWGAASSAYQLEGGAYDDGKGLNIWDVFCRKEGKIANGDTGEVSTDHYHRYAEDVAIMKSMGLGAYRLSISWPRVLPDGIGAVNKAGLDFYDRLIDELLGAGITPYVTLFHWDYPYALYCRGGWLSPDSPDWFAQYTQVVMDKLSDRVSHWFTMNEPNVVVGQGHMTGRSAPGVQLQVPERFCVLKHGLLAHGKAVQVIRAGAKSKPKVGIVSGLSGVVPATEDPADVAATRKLCASVSLGSPESGGWWSEICLRGEFPEALRDAICPGVFDISDADIEQAHQELDFYGGNLYYGQYIRAGANGEPERLPRPPGYAQTARNWPITPRAMYWGPKLFYERYGLPILISESGMSNADYVSADGKVHDPQRIEFIRQYLLQLKRAIDDGVPILGYLHWSILDSFEWMFGYNYRFGMVHVDYETFKRTPKDSAEFYSQVIATNGANLKQK